jgi:dolichol-phosphate mannosyltransferase
MKLSVVIPAHNEQECIEATVWDIVDALSARGIPHEIIVVDDSSSDRTGQILQRLAQEIPTVRTVQRSPPPGFGRAIRDGLQTTAGDAVAIVMGDASDDPQDLCMYYDKLEQGFDCVFGSRFQRGTTVRDYPPVKLIVNRVANNFIRILFGVHYNDMTNAFKAYRAEVIEAISPIQANHFNITVELPLKAIARGFSYTAPPINWYGRESGVSKLTLRQMGRKYLFTVLYVWLEKHLMADEYPFLATRGRSEISGSETDRSANRDSPSAQVGEEKVNP